MAEPRSEAKWGRGIRASARSGPPGPGSLPQDWPAHPPIGRRSSDERRRASRRCSNRLPLAAHRSRWRGASTCRNRPAFGKPLSNASRTARTLTRTPILTNVGGVCAEVRSANRAGCCSFMQFSISPQRSKSASTAAAPPSARHSRRSPRGAGCPVASGPPCRPRAAQGYPPHARLAGTILENSEEFADLNPPLSTRKANPGRKGRRCLTSRCDRLCSSQALFNHSQCRNRAGPEGRILRMTSEQPDVCAVPVPS